MSYKILFTDMDGTLLDSAKQISPALLALLQKLTDSGRRLVLSTGRTISSIEKVLERTGLIFPDMLVIAANGNIVYDWNRRRYLVNKTVPLSMAKEIVSMADGYGLHIQTYTDTHAVCHKKTPESLFYHKGTGMDFLYADDIMSLCSEPPCKLLAIDLKDRSRLTLLQKDVLDRFGGTLTATFSCNEYLEIFDRTAGKGSAVRFICDHLHVPAAETVAVGDAENDISMLQAAGIGAAMANAAPEVKQSADFITEADNDHDGLAEVLHRFFQL